jgi:hypothetical protein
LYQVEQPEDFWAFPRLRPPVRVSCGERCGCSGPRATEPLREGRHDGPLRVEVPAESPERATKRLFAHIARHILGIYQQFPSSGRADSNRRPLDPQSSALTKLRHGPDVFYLGV